MGVFTVSSIGMSTSVSMWMCCDLCPLITVWAVDSPGFCFPISSHVVDHSVRLRQFRCGRMPRNHSIWLYYTRCALNFKSFQIRRPLLGGDLLSVFGVMGPAEGVELLLICTPLCALIGRQILRRVIARHGGGGPSLLDQPGDGALEQGRASKKHPFPDAFSTVFNFR